MGRLAAAGGEGETAGPVTTLTDALGREVVFHNYPERVLLAGKAVVFSTNSIYLFPAAVKRVVGTGITDQGLGDFFPVVEPNAGSKLKFNNNAGPEQLITAAPDVVILKHYLKNDLGDSLEELDIPVLYFNSETPGAFYADIEMFGALLDDRSRSRDIIDFYTTKYRMITESVRGREKPSVLLVSYSKRDGNSAFSVPASGWLQTTLVEDAGGRAVWKDDNPGGGWKKVNLEQVASWDPAYIFVVSYNTPARSVVDEVSEGLGLGMLDSQIMPFPGDFYSWDQPDTRWILGLMWTAKVLHPDLFETMNLEDEIRTFYSFLYGLDDKSIEREIIPKVSPLLSGLK